MLFCPVISQNFNKLVNQVINYTIFSIQVMFDCVEQHKVIHWIADNGLKCDWYCDDKALKKYWFIVNNLFWWKNQFQIKIQPFSSKYYSYFHWKLSWKTLLSHTLWRQSFLYYTIYSKHSHIYMSKEGGLSLQLYEFIIAQTPTNTYHFIAILFMLWPKYSSIKITSLT